MKKKKEIKILDKNIKRKVQTFMLIITAICFLFQITTPVYADDDPLSVINNFSDFVFSVTRAIGTIFLTFGVVQFGMSYQSHDPSQRTTGIFSVVAGIIIAFAKQIINFIIK